MFKQAWIGMGIVVGLMLLMVMCGVSAAERRVTYEAPSGCIWRQTHGFCMVSNTMSKPVTCTVYVFLRTVNTEKKYTYEVTVQPGKFDDKHKVFTDIDDPFRDMSANAQCRVTR